MRSHPWIPLLLAASAAAGAQSLPNPAGMAPDTPRMETGNPPPDHANTQDKLFVRQATLGGRAEVELGRLARQKGSAESVKQFGARMETDHGQANQRLARIAARAQPSIPDGLDAHHQQIRQRLDGVSGRDFDLAYLQSQVMMHQVTANLLLWEMSFGQSAELTKYAADTLPAVMAHLETAKESLAALTSTPPRN